MQKSSESFESPNNFAVAQINRLSGLRYFPEMEVAVAELVKALATAAPNDEAAQRFTDDWIRESVTAPTPRDIYEHFTTRAEAAKEYTPIKFRSAVRCTVCNDMGFSIVAKGDYTFAFACPNCLVPKLQSDQAAQLVMPKRSRRRRTT